MGDVIVLGGGVLGLTAALEVSTSQRLKCQVHILARDIATSPSALTSQDWASPWAGFNWCSFANKQDVVTQRRDRLTYEAWKGIVERREVPSQVMEAIPFKQYLNDDAPPYSSGDRWFDELVDEFQYHPSSSTDPRAHITYKSFCVATAGYLQYLHTRLAALSNVHIHPPTETFQSLASVFSHPSVAHLDSERTLLINATGMGPLFLKDVQDGDVFPIRGQTVLVQAGPRFARSPRCIMDAGNADRPPAYIIPRASSGQVILGGTFGKGDWHREARDEDTERILRQCAALCPELLDDDNEDNDETEPERWRKLYSQIVSVNVGLRPARKGDVTRVELDAVRAQSTPDQPAIFRPILHCYGAGKAGYQGSIGIAREVEELVHSHFASLA